MLAKMKEYNNSRNSKSGQNVDKKPWQILIVVVYSCCTNERDVPEGAKIERFYNSACLITLTKGKLIVSWKHEAF